MLLREIQDELFKLQDVKYRDFHKKLIPTVGEERIIGVRTPEMRKLAKEFAKREDINEFLSDLPHKYFDENQAQYIYNVFPKQTVNVLYFGGTSTLTPLHFGKGKWETAFRLTDYRPVGFNLQNTPFGNEQFDMYALKKKVQQKVRYQDIFTGIIINASENRFWEEPPFPDHCLTKAAEKYYAQLLADSLIQPHQTVYGIQATELDSNRQSSTIEGFINSQNMENPKSMFPKVFMHLSLSWWHYIDVIFAAVLWLLSVLILIVYLPIKTLKGHFQKA